MREEMREGSERSGASTRPASGGLRPRLPGIHCPLSKLPNHMLLKYMLQITYFCRSTKLHAFVVQITKLCDFKLHAPNCMLTKWMLPLSFDVVALLSRCFGRNVSAKLEERRAALRERERERER